MTEAEWLSSTDPEALVRFLHERHHLSARKARLFAVACCRRMWPFLKDQRSRTAVEAAERYADGFVTPYELNDHHARAGAAVSEAERYYNRDGGVARHAMAHAAWYTVAPDSYRPAREVLLIVACLTVETETRPIPIEAIVACDESRLLSGLVRDVFGLLPFGLPSVDPRWVAANGSAVQQLAQTIYDDRTFDILPILADALEEAGCADADILDHCRGPGPHVPGCWVIDLLLGKK